MSAQRRLRPVRLGEAEQTVVQVSARRQYQQLKKRFPDAILFFQLGDFYETFEEDAAIVARVCDITLTSRDMGVGSRLPLAGVPVHSSEGYIAKLVKAGYRVAICQQIEKAPRQRFTQVVAGERGPASKGPLARDVTRVVTPGTVVEPGLLDEKANNYLAAVVVEASRAGLAYADITTGEFACTQIPDSAQRARGADPWPVVVAELGRLQPAECLVPNRELRNKPAGGPSNGAEGEQAVLGGFNLTPLDAHLFQLEGCRDALRRHFDVASLEAFGCANQPLAIRAAGALVQYLAETQLPGLRQLTGLRTYDPGAFMSLDPATRRNLELQASNRGGGIKGSLLAVLDRTGTPMGGRLLRAWLNCPLLDLARLHSRQGAVALLCDQTLLRVRLLDLLRKTGDLERVVHRVAQGIASPREVLALSSSLEIVAEIEQILGSTLAERGEAGREDSRLAKIAAHLDAVPEAAALIGQAIVPDPAPSFSDGGVIAGGFSVELDALRDGSKDARQYVAALEATERERTGIKSLKVGYNKVFGYFIELSHPALRTEVSEQQLAEARRMQGVDATQGNRPLPTSSREFLEQFCGYLRKQTLVGAERYITPELKEKEALILNAQERIAELEATIFRQVCQQIAGHAKRLLRTARALAQLDVFVALADTAVRNQYVRPELDDGEELQIVGGRHPVVEQALQDSTFVPNDCHLSNHEQQVILLTGPNMAGKSTFLRQVAIIALLAQIGSFVPARSARIGLIDRIFTRVGAQDDIATGQSTFMVEMAETAYILSHASRRSLVIFDEIGRGTSTYDGLAIARAVVEHVHNHPRLGCKTLFATHYHELIELEAMLPRVNNYRMDVLEEGSDVVFLHRVVQGAASRSYGIYVAQLAGIPKAVTRRAEELLRDLEEGRQRAERAKRSPAMDGVMQLSLFLEPHPIVDDLRRLDVDALSPLEAIAKLYELRRKVRDDLA